MDMNGISLDLQQKDMRDEQMSLKIFKRENGIDQSSTSLNGAFLHSQLLIDVLLQDDPSPEKFQEFIDWCEISYVRKGDISALKVLQEFRESYSNEQAILLYTKYCFFYTMLNEALRNNNIDRLVLLGFVIRDLHSQLHKLQKIQMLNNIIRVHRGQNMSKEEFNRLRISIGDLISMNSFLSTSRDDRVAKMYRESNATATGDGLLSVLFQIDVDPQLQGVPPLADISSHSQFGDEAETLFTLGCIFRVVNVCEEDGINIIQMTLCSYYDNDLKPLFDYLKRQNEDHFLALGDVFYRSGHFDKARRFYKQTLDKAVMTHDDNLLARCYQRFGTIAENQEAYEESIIWFKKQYELSQRTLPPNHLNFASIHLSIGNVLQAIGNPTNAIDSYNMALNIFLNHYGEEHECVAGCFSNLSTVYKDIENYDKALDFLQKSLCIRQRCLPAYHPDSATCHGNIAAISNSIRLHDLALFHYEQALKIRIKSLPPDHPDIARTYNNIGIIYLRVGKRATALPYLQEAASLYCKLYPPNDSARVEIEKVISLAKSRFRWRINHFLESLF